MAANARSSVIKRNIMINMLGSAWSTVLLLAIVPIQIKILGVEAYGLLAFLASVQILLNVFDLGLSPTVTREVAADQSPDFRHSRNLMQSVTLVYWGIGVLLSLALAASAPWLVTGWLRLDGLAPDMATLVIQLGALAILLRWPSTLFGGVIAGRQRFDLLNLLSTGFVTVGLLGGIAVILLSSNIIALMVWRVVTALIETTASAIVCFRLLPGLTIRPRIRSQLAKQVSPFAGSMSALAIQGLLLTQSDRFIISKVLPIVALGYYVLAFNTAASLITLQSTVSSVMFPAFTADYVRGEREVLALRCLKAVQIVTFCLAFPAFLLVFFGYDVLQVWIDRETAQSTYLVLAILALAALLNAPLNVLSTLAISTGKMRSLLLMNIGGLFGYLPCVYLLVTRFSLLGAAVAFLLLQVFYLTVFPPVALRVLEEPHARTWLVRNAFPFILLGVTTVGLAKVAVTTTGGGIVVGTLAGVVAGMAYLAFAFVAFHEDLQRTGQHVIGRATLGLRRAVGLLSGTRVG
jgi:O-antigen/teichoic acid export membrane protein